MIGLFKSHYSLGKSILTLKLPEKDADGGASSIFSILARNNLSRLVLVEDTLTGFLEAYGNCKSLGIKLVFGLRLTMCTEAATYEKGDGFHKIILFARTPNGIGLLNQLYSLAFTQYEGRLDFSLLSEIFDKKHLKLYVPFYDSFLHSNLTSYRKPCIPTFRNLDPVFFIENNYLPFDSLIRDAVKEYCTINNFSMANAKSIYYEKREDFEAYQVYKCLCNRAYSGKNISLNTPNLDHCASPEFCFESYAQHAIT